MSGETKIGMTFASIDTAAQAAFDRNKKGLQGIAKAAKEVEKATDGAHASGQKFFSANVSGAAKTLAAWAGVGTVLGTVATAAAQFRREYDAFLARRRESGSYMLNVADAEANIDVNYKDRGQDMTKRQLKAFAGKLAETTGVDRASAGWALADVASAKEGVPMSEAARTTGLIAAYNPRWDASHLSNISGASVDLQKRFGLQGEQAFGMITAIHGNSRVTDMEKFAHSGVPTVLGMEAYHNSARQAGAFFGALTNLSADKEGDSSKTALMGFAKQLDAAAIAKIPALAGKSTWQIREHLTAKNRDAATEAVRLQLSGMIDSEIGRAGEGGSGDLTARAAQLPYLKQLLMPGSNAEKKLHQTYAALPEYKDAGKLYAEEMAGKSKDGAGGVAAIDSAMNAALQHFKGNEQMARAGVSRQRLEQILDQSGVGSQFGKDAALLRFDMATSGDRDGAAAARDELQRQAQALRADVGFGAAAGGFGGGIRHASERDKSTAEVLEKLVARLDELIAATKANKEVSVTEDRSGASKRNSTPKQAPTANLNAGK